MYKKPVDEIVEKLKNSQKNSIFLLGALGSGKSTILKQYLDNNRSMAINATEQKREQIEIPDDKIFRLYQICLIIKKIIVHLYEKYGLFTNDILKLKNEVDDNIYNINIMSIIGKFDDIFDLNLLILYNPEALIYRLLKIIKNHNLPLFTLVVDNYDKTDNSSERYQSVIKEFSKYFRVIMSISDYRFIKDENKKRDIEKTNNLVEINYSYDVETVKSIILDDIKRLIILHKDFKYLVLPVIEDEVISELIKITNGNLNDIKLAINFLLLNIDYIPKEGYSDFLIDYALDEINSINKIRKNQIKQRTLKIY